MSILIPIEIYLNLFHFRPVNTVPLGEGGRRGWRNAVTAPTVVPRCNTSQSEGPIIDPAFLHTCDRERAVVDSHDFHIVCIFNNSKKTLSWWIPNWKVALFGLKIGYKYKKWTFFFNLKYFFILVSCNLVKLYRYISSCYNVYYRYMYNKFILSFYLYRHFYSNPIPVVNPTASVTVGGGGILYSSW